MFIGLVYILTLGKSLESNAQFLIHSSIWVGQIFCIFILLPLPVHICEYSNCLLNAVTYHYSVHIVVSSGIAIMLSEHSSPEKKLYGHCSIHQKYSAVFLHRTMFTWSYPFIDWSMPWKTEHSRRTTAWNTWIEIFCLNAHTTHACYIIQFTNGRTFVKLTDQIDCHLDTIWTWFMLLTCNWKGTTVFLFKIQRKKLPMKDK